MKKRETTVDFFLIYCAVHTHTIVVIQFFCFVRITRHNKRELLCIFIHRYTLIVVIHVELTEKLSSLLLKCHVKIQSHVHKQYYTEGFLDVSKFPKSNPCKNYESRRENCPCKVKLDLELLSRLLRVSINSDAIECFARYIVIKRTWPTVGESSIHTNITRVSNMSKKTEYVQDNAFRINIL